ncbi:MAG: hypothetical protein ACTHLN_11575, partial [Tepidisphaeraceae bacterium]
MASGFLEDDHDLLVFIDGYIKLVESEFVERWNVWPVVIEDMAQTEVIAGLLRRQVSLAKHMAMS